VERGLEERCMMGSVGRKINFELVKYRPEGVPLTPDWLISFLFFFFYHLIEMKVYDIEIFSSAQTPLALDTSSSSRVFGNNIWCKWTSVPFKKPG